MNANSNTKDKGNPGPGLTLCVHPSQGKAGTCLSLGLDVVSRFHSSKFEGFLILS